MALTTNIKGYINGDERGVYDPTINATSISIVPEYNSGGTYTYLDCSNHTSTQFIVTLTPSNATNSITWTSSNPAAVTIDQNGVATYVRPAKESTITATTDNGLSATFRVLTSCGGVL